MLGMLAATRPLGPSVLGLGSSNSVMGSANQTRGRDYFVPGYVLQAQLNHIESGNCSYYQGDLAKIGELKQSIVSTLREMERWHSHTTAEGTIRHIHPLNEGDTVDVGEQMIPGRQDGVAETFVYSAGERRSSPGTSVLKDWEPDSAAKDEDAAFVRQGMRDFLGYMQDVHGYNSIDDDAYDLHFTLHFGRQYNNAFWDGTQMVTGDGDGVLFHPLHKDLSVVDHEIGHGLTENNAGIFYDGTKRAGGLDYWGESGAANEAYSDIFAVLANAYRKGLTLDQMTEVDWAIGAVAMVGNNRDGGKAALRTFLAKLAYDRPDIGRDPQPKHMRDKYQGRGDNGGVHYNSGILNHAFYRMGQHLIEAAKSDESVNLNPLDNLGPIWFEAQQKMHANVSFKEINALLLETAEELFPDEPVYREAVAKGLEDVGINVNSFWENWYRVRSTAAWLASAFTSLVS